MLVRESLADSQRYWIQYSRQSGDYSEQEETAQDIPHGPRDIAEGVYQTNFEF